MDGLENNQRCKCKIQLPLARYWDFVLLIVKINSAFKIPSAVYSVAKQNHYS